MLNDIVGTQKTELTLDYSIKQKYLLVYHSKTNIQQPWTDVVTHNIFQCHNWLKSLLQLTCPQNCLHSYRPNPSSKECSWSSDELRRIYTTGTFVWPVVDYWTTTAHSNNNNSNNKTTTTTQYPPLDILSTDPEQSDPVCMRDCLMTWDVTHSCSSKSNSDSSNNNKTSTERQQLDNVQRTHRVLSNGYPLTSECKQSYQFCHCLFRTVSCVVLIVQVKVLLKFRSQMNVLSRWRLKLIVMISLSIHTMRSKGRMCVCCVTNDLHRKEVWMFTKQVTVEKSCIPAVSVESVLHFSVTWGVICMFTALIADTSVLNVESVFETRMH